MPLGKSTEGLLYEKQWGDLKSAASKFNLKAASSENVQLIIGHMFNHLLNALRHFHDKTKCCHNDIKPENILLTENSDTGLILTDYGSAHPTRDKSRGYTPEYCSSEFVDPR